MVVPSTADGFRADVSALRSLDGKKGVSFHTFTLPEDRCVRLLVKNLGRGMRESVVREELESRTFVSWVSHSCVPAVATRTPPRTVLAPPTSLYQWREVLRCRKYDLSPNSAACECRWNRTWPRKAHCNASAASALDTQRNSSYATRCVACGGSHLSGGCSTPREEPQCCGCGGNHMSNYRGCVKWKETKAALAKQAPDRGRKSAATAHFTAPKEQRAGPSAEQMDLGEGWNHVVRGGVVKTTTLQPLFQIPLPSWSRKLPRSLN